MDTLEEAKAREPAPTMPEGDPRAPRCASDKLYEPTRGRIITHFCLGFIAPVLAVVLLIVGYNVIDVYPYNEAMYVAAPVITVLLFLIAVAYFFKSGRRYIATGLLAGLVVSVFIPLLFVGLSYLLFVWLFDL